MAKKCKVCKSEFNQFSSLQVACSPKCALELVAQKKAKKHKQELTAFRKGDKSIAKLRAEAQKEFNTYIRVRDSGKPCPCCGRTYPDDSGEWDAGHYRSRGSARQLAYNTYNCHRQAKHCNRYLGGNYSEYRIGLIKRIGLDKVERLESDNAVRRFDKEYLIRIKQIFAKRARHLKKIREK
jgi:hypothetical protein